MPDLKTLRIKLFADGADLATIINLSKNPLIKGFTTNPTLMRKAGIGDYKKFAREVLMAVPDRPVSFEVFSDDFDEMEEQAIEIASWGSNVNVKIPVTNTHREFSGPLLRRLSQVGVFLNVTAVMTREQVKQILEVLPRDAKAYISVFAGRIADTGRDPVPMMASIVEMLRPYPNTQLIWASPRELLNIFQADAIGCQVITATNDVLGKLPLVGKDLSEYSLETVQMFRRDALQAGFAIGTQSAKRVASAGQPRKR